MKNKSKITLVLVLSALVIYSIFCAFKQAAEKKALNEALLITKFFYSQLNDSVLQQKLPQKGQPVLGRDIVNTDGYNGTWGEEGRLYFKDGFQYRPDCWESGCAIVADRMPAPGQQSKYQLMINIYNDGTSEFKCFGGKKGLYKRICSYTKNFDYKN